MDTARLHEGGWSSDFHLQIMDQSSGSHDRSSRAYLRLARLSCV